MDVNEKSRHQPTGTFLAGDQGIFEGKDSRKAGSSRVGPYLSSTGNIRSTEKHRICQERSGRAAQDLEHWSIEEKKST